ncbi:hypothetical protein GALMADRAFT_53655 [Galerina marginata CBS 339.88]|uniref:Uncharacterized protein n=1 Tax=Galerina marginata (strain CBS 339.88) TaxID=685588 RepID=A0A067TPL1_GALM3|nr:hypothetical protein GALMADRAFT_53655 [Galerina marginata CBS 339.88]
MSTSSRHRPPSLPSTTSLNHATSLRSFRRPPPPVTTVVTSPPWARDEPPSPTEPLASPHDGPHVTESRISDVASFQSNPSEGTSRWWTFTLPRTRQDTFNLTPATPKTEKKSFRDISLSWIPASASQRLGEGSTFIRKEKEKEAGHDLTPHLSMPLPAQHPVEFTLAHNNTPGWDTPWTPRPAAQGPSRDSGEEEEESYGFRADSHSDSSHKNLSGWALRRKQIRSFILVNTYVPLLFRFINIAFTTAALGMAIRIRNVEIKYGAAGAVGSSPTVVIIFAPLTLVHVMVAIYLEYFGRPLGLWRTSAKLAHTLSEVLFICAWSAALSLCFDNFFTSLIPCASESASSWYNKLPRPAYNIPNFESSLGDQICDEQLSLICLVGVGLIAYCSNLIISLYRVFEKVKYHPAHPSTAVRRT